MSDTEERFKKISELTKLVEGFTELYPWQREVIDRIMEMESTTIHELLY